MKKVFDPQHYKTTTREQWQTAAEAWHRWHPTLKRWLGPATDLMLDMAEVKEGYRVLDIAAGAGEQSITAAEKVGPNGYVLATDLAPKILDFAVELADEKGINNIEVQEMDGENLTVPDNSFDTVISRVGLIFFPDQQKALKSTVFAQMDCKKCDIEKVKTVNENIDNLTFQMVEDFLCTFDNSCRTNIEYSEWSNEMLYKLLESDPNLVFKVLEQSQGGNIETLLDEIENPIHDFDYQKIHDKISDVRTKSNFKEKVLKSIELAADKEGTKIKK